MRCFYSFPSRRLSQIKKLSVTSCELHPLWTLRRKPRYSDSQAAAATPPRSQDAKPMAPAPATCTCSNPQPTDMTYGQPSQHLLLTTPSSVGLTYCSLTPLLMPPVAHSFSSLLATQTVGPTLASHLPFQPKVKVQPQPAIQVSYSSPPFVFLLDLPC